jgi:hypothetical protein
VAGTSTVGSGSTAARRIGVVRFLPGGQLDPTFGTNGVEVVAIAGAKLEGNAVGLHANGDINLGRDDHHRGEHARAAAGDPAAR